ncbi:pentatricopeptide repeat-containing protein At5g67570, chloroplastic [Aristolochia californica]|uniref:pentatricopeptide repeat-containing protein At5g67570, chloroplastic n=1 Tax=Aristolochia californica TaxID=171875 RepID=UPI0035DC3A30
MDATLCSQVPSIPSTETIKRRLLKKGAIPTPKILRTLQKKETQKSLRRSKRLAEKTLEKPPSESQKQEMEAEDQYRTIAREYRTFRKMLRVKNGDMTVRKPWEREMSVDLREFARERMEYGGEKLRKESLDELKKMMAERSRQAALLLLEDEFEEDSPGEVEGKEALSFKYKKPLMESDAIRLLIKRITATNLSSQDWKFCRLMKHPGFIYTEHNLLKLVEELGELGHWRHSMSVVEWVYNCKDYMHYKSRYVYTKLLAVLGKARRPSEALHIFNHMREDCHIYPDMPAYRSIAVTLGQAGLVNELWNIIECMRRKPTAKTKNLHRRNWDPCLEPDIVIFNALLNACVSSRQWKGVSWVFRQMRQNGIRPTVASYGLAMEVMLKSKKYDLVYKLFEKTRGSGLAPNALTFKILVRAFWEEGKVNDAVEAVREMEQRGVVGIASVYYELACCLCYHGRWQEAMREVVKLKKLPFTKPLEVTFTGMILSCMDGGHIHDCLSVFEQMKIHCSPNVGTINVMLKVYGQNDMFARAKELFEGIRNISTGEETFLGPDAYSYNAMLEASASAHQWEYFEHVYKEMVLHDHHLDQKRHASMLVEASKAGKWHLLDHAFDLILEAGEIPYKSIFFEMICHNISQDNSERLVTLLNCMGHASLHVSEKQWTSLFNMNKDRVSHNKLQKLLGVLGDSEVMTEEISISNLLKSLRYICGLPSVMDSTHSDMLLPEPTVSDSDGYVNDNTDESDVDVHGDTCSIYDTEGHQSDIFSLHWGDEGDGDKFDVRADNSVAFLNNRDQGTCSDDYLGNSDNEQIGSGSTIVKPTLESTDIIFSLLNSHDYGSEESTLPSASEILKAWQENRNKDGIFL